MLKLAAPDHGKRPRVFQRVFTALCWLFLWLGMAISSHEVQARPAPVTVLSSPHDIINGVNAIRVARGLPAYRVDNALMAAAQAQSDYQASIGSTTHTGEGGSSVTSRALAAGYGGGASVSVAENVWGGGGGSAQAAVNWWANDSLHLETMISTRYQDVGAGVAEKNGNSYYTLVAGVVSGDPGSAATQLAWSQQATAAPPTGGSDATPSGSTNGAGSGSTIVSTPGPDGSIIHVVAAGETIWSIAAAYDVGVAEVLRINGLNANLSVIVPGQKITILPPGSLPTATFGLADAEGTPVQEASIVSTEPAPPTIPPRPSPTIVAQNEAETSGTAVTSSPDRAVVSPFREWWSELGIDPILLGIGALVVMGMALLAAGAVMRRS